jgi:hypothetical protein
MGPIGIDLKNLLEQDRLLALDVLETSRKLVLELQAAHYWTTQSLDVFNSLRNIGGNLKRLLEALAPHLGTGQAIFERPEGLKLWNTALGLWQALPPTRNRFSEHLSRRRRERIMGQAIIELEELDAAQVEADSNRYQAALNELTTLYQQLEPLITAFPAGLIPAQLAQAEGSPAANGQMVAAKAGASVDAIAAPLPGATQSGVGAQGGPATPPEALPPEDDLTPA